MAKISIGNTPTRYIPISKWSIYHPWPTANGLRKLIFDRKSNGFEKVIVKVGKRILIDERAFFEWMKDQKPTS